MDAVFNFKMIFQMRQHERVGKKIVGKLANMRFLILLVIIELGKMTENYLISLCNSMWYFVINWISTVQHYFYFALCNSSLGF